MKNGQTHNIPFRRNKHRYAVAYFRALYARMRLSPVGTIGAGSVFRIVVLLPFASPAIWRWRKFALFPHWVG